MPKPEHKDFSSMTKEELVALLDRIADAVRGEDAGDICLWIAELLEVDVST